jgi:hypothetical protein
MFVVDPSTLSGAIVIVALAVVLFAASAGLGTVVRRRNRVRLENAGANPNQTFRLRVMRVVGWTVIWGIFLLWPPVSGTRVAIFFLLVVPFSAHLMVSYVWSNRRDN